MCEEAYRSGSRSRRRCRAHLQQLRDRSQAEWAEAVDMHLRAFEQQRQWLDRRSGERAGRAPPPRPQ
eukprot:4360403-Pyramimonas_sp.AAC.1